MADLFGQVGKSFFAARILRKEDGEDAPQFPEFSQRSRRSPCCGLRSRDAYDGDCWARIRVFNSSLSTGDVGNA